MLNARILVGDAGQVWIEADRRGFIVLDLVEMDDWRRLVALIEDDLVEDELCHDRRSRRDTSNTMLTSTSTAPIATAVSKSRSNCE